MRSASACSSRSSSSSWPSPLPKADLILITHSHYDHLDSAAVAAAGGQYLRGYILDCCFAGLHFCFSGYFCAIGRSELSFLHNITAVVLVRVPGAYLMSKWFPTTLLPMGLATAAGSLLSVIICVIAFLVLRRRGRLVPEED